MSQIALISRNGTAPKRQEFLKQTVQDFFGTLDWEGITPPKPAAAPSVASSSEDLFADFAADFGADLESGLGIDAGTALDLKGSIAHTPPIQINTTTLSVAAFFSCFPWEGQPAIGAPVKAETPVGILPQLDRESTDNLTLDAFSDLF